MCVMSGLSRKYKAFARKQDGNATIEFVFLFPMFIGLFLMGFESGYYMVRNVMLERAVDVAVRDVRLGNGRVPEFRDLKERICAQAGILPDCVNSLQIEMQPVNIVPGGTDPVKTPAKCVDKLSTEDPRTGTTYEVGRENQMMIVRVCALSQPLFPSTGIGVGLRVDAEGNYAMVATTAFVNEPGNRAIAPYMASAPVGGKSKGNNGYGNGDQDAPGNSLDTNNAENDQTPGSNGNSGNGGNSAGNSNNGQSGNSGMGSGSNGSKSNNKGGNGIGNGGDDDDDDDNGDDD